MKTTEKKTIKGGEFLIKETLPQDVFIPEEWNEEQKMIKQTCEEFIHQEIFPKLDEIDSMKSPDLIPQLLEKAGKLGLLGTSIPESYGGFGMRFNTTMLVTEVIGASHSFAVALSAHTGIGTLPIYYYGNEQQKEKYLPKLASGEWKAAYCLTEPDAGSDANSGKTKAKLSGDGNYYLINGQKMWITNGGFADVFTVFAKIDDDKNLSAFIVEKTFEGIRMNEEEKKMGIKGSSTRQIFFNDCKVPVENMLFKRNEGLKIALNILNVGRIKLGIAAIGASKKIISSSVMYANERKQFGKSIAEFGAIQHKLAQMAIYTFASESAHYRVGQNIEDTYNIFCNNGMDSSQAKLESTEEYAVECALLKIHGSEVLDFCADEGVQIFGGMGYSADAEMERSYRDARINRIFEGTNEINRMLSIDMLLKRSLKGRIDLITAVKAVQKELMAIPDFGQTSTEIPFAEEKNMIKNLKKATLMIAGAAVQKYLNKIEDEQEILMNLSDMLMECYVAESVLLRVEKMTLQKEEDAVIMNLMRVYIHEAVEKIRKAGYNAITSFAQADEQKMMLIGLRRFTKIKPVNLKNARRNIAQHLISRNKYCF